MSFVVHKYYKDHRQPEDISEQLRPDGHANITGEGEGDAVDDNNGSSDEVVTVDDGGADDTDRQQGGVDSQRYSKEMIVYCAVNFLVNYFVT